MIYLLSLGAFAILGGMVGYWLGRSSVENVKADLFCQYRVARDELAERERHLAHAQTAGFMKIDCCEQPVGCMDTVKVGLN